MKVQGLGFMVEPAVATSWISQDARNKEVLFPCLNGDDINSRPDLSAPRWIVDFNDLSEAKASAFELPFLHLSEFVKPERQRLKADGTYVLRKPLPQRWWQYGDKRPALRAAIEDLEHVLVLAFVSKHVLPMRVPTGQVFTHRLEVFATSAFGDLALLSSSMHWLWAVTYSSTLETRVNYSPSDAFLTFPRPPITEELSPLGLKLDTERLEIMRRRQLGLTKLYNLVNDPSLTDSADTDVARLRAIHADLDAAVMEAYGWSDVPLDHGFHTYRQMERWTVGPAARVEVLDRLLQENQRRAAREAAEWGGKAATGSGAADEAQGELFEEET